MHCRLPARRPAKRGAMKTGLLAGLALWGLAAHLSPAAGAEASFEVTGDRGENFRAAVTLKNADERAVGDWTLDMALDRTIVQAFGAEATQIEPGRWRFRPADWTREIPAKGEVRFTFIGRPGGLPATSPALDLDVTYAAPVAKEAPAAPPVGETAARPSDAQPSPAPAAGAPRQQPAERPQAQPEQAAVPPRPAPAPAAEAGTAVPHTLGFKLKDAWAEGFVGEMAVVNQGERTLRPWRFEFALDAKIQDAWGAAIKPAGEGRWVAVPENYNSEIEPGSFATFGFKAVSKYAGRPASTKLLQGE